MNYNEEDIRRFKKALKKGECFKKRYTAFDGEIVAILRWPEKPEIDLILEDIEQRRKQGTSSAILKRKMKEFRLACCLEYLKTPKFSLSFYKSVFDYNSLNEFSHKKLDFLSEVEYNILIDVSTAFKKMMEKILQRIDIGIDRTENEAFIRANKELLE